MASFGVGRRRAGGRGRARGAKLTSVGKSAAERRRILPPMDDGRLGVLGGEVDAMLTRQAAYATFAPTAAYVKHRRVLVEFMAQVVDEFGLTQATLHMAVNHVDRALSRFVICRTKWQLVAICAVLIAAKYAEPAGRVPSVSAFVLCAEGAYPQREVVQMERSILVALSWNVRPPSILEFAAMYAEVSDLLSGRAHASRDLERRQTRLARVALMHYEFNQWSASVVGACVVQAARIMSDLPPVWASCSKHSRSDDLRRCVQLLFQVYKQEYDGSPPSSPVSALDFAPDAA